MEFTVSRAETRVTRTQAGDEVPEVVGPKVRYSTLVHALESPLTPTAAHRLFLFVRSPSVHRCAMWPSWT